MSEIGYGYLCSALRLPVLAPSRVAVIGPSMHVLRLKDRIVVPKTVAPTSAGPLDHVLFALKHEGTNLQVLSEALPRIPGEHLLERLYEAPNGQYIRTACFLWEMFTGQLLRDLPAIGGATVPLFDPDRYFTTEGTRNARWRVNFNGLGTLRYCPVVERTPEIEALIGKQILEQANNFARELGPTVLDRALEWAYLHETRDSFAIEREAPTADKARRFVALLHQAQDQSPISEDYLVQLQNETINNPRDQASEYRSEQNHLAGPALRGPAAVTYVPPPPALARVLMEQLVATANNLPGAVDPLVMASVVSFGFVFIHPFMDGNGRLSRFLFHKTLCLSGKLEKGLLLPVSIAMKNDEAGYLAALQQFSKPTRSLWNIRNLDSDRFDFEFIGGEGVYRYWDATPCVEFGLRMAESALETQLRQEALFLIRYDAIKKAVDDRYDVRQSELAKLISSCLNNGNVVSKNRRKEFYYLPAELFDYIEERARAATAEHENREPNPAPGTPGERFTG